MSRCLSCNTTLQVKADLGYSPIRLLVAILNTVGTHGWSVTNSMRAGSAKVGSPHRIFRGS